MREITEVITVCVAIFYYWKYRQLKKEADKAFDYIRSQQQTYKP